MATQPSEVDWGSDERTTSATATGPWRRLREEAALEGSPDAVWRVLRAFGDVANWAPGIASSRCLGDLTSGIGARRLMRHQWGFPLEEVVTAWEEGRSYSFLVVRAPFPLNVVLETWTVTQSDDHTLVETTVVYDTFGGPIGRLIDRLLLRHLVRREMRRGLGGLRSCLADSQQQR